MSDLFCFFYYNQASLYRGGYNRFTPYWIKSALWLTSDKRRDFHLLCELLSAEELFGLAIVNTANIY